MMILVIFPHVMSQSCHGPCGPWPSPGVRSVTVSAFTAAMKSRDVRQLGQAGPCDVQGAIQASQGRRAGSRGQQKWGISGTLIGVYKL